MIWEFERWQVQVDYYQELGEDAPMIQIAASMDVPTVGRYGGHLYNTRIGFKIPIPNIEHLKIKERCALHDAATRHIPAEPHFLSSFLYDLGKELTRA